MIEIIIIIFIIFSITILEITNIIANFAPKIH